MAAAVASEAAAVLGSSSILTAGGDVDGTDEEAAAANDPLAKLLRMELPMIGGAGAVAGAMFGVAGFVGALGCASTELLSDAASSLTMAGGVLPRMASVIAWSSGDFEAARMVPSPSPREADSEAERPPVRLRPIETSGDLCMEKREGASESDSSSSSSDERTDMLVGRLHTLRARRCWIMRASARLCTDSSSSASIPSRFTGRMMGDVEMR